MTGDKGFLNHNWKGGLVDKKCIECDSHFDVKPCREKKARFCSMKCANDWQRKHPYIGIRATRITKECRKCNVIFVVTESSANRKNFCSRKCHLKWRSEHCSGSNNPNWNGGTRSEKYPPEFYAIRKSILTRDGNACACPMCRTNDKRVVVHHIDFNKNNCSDDNLITVCPSCNARANFKRQLWTAMLKSFLRSRITRGELNLGYRGQIEIKP